MIAGLKVHSDLAQETSDVRIVHASLQCLQRVWNTFSELAELAKAGRLSEAVSKGREVDEVVKEMPEFLQQTHVANDLKVRLYVKIVSFLSSSHFTAAFHSDENPCSRPTE